MRRSRDKRAESSLSEQPVGGQGGGGLRDLELPTTSCVPPTRGSKNWDQYLLVSLVAPRSLKRAMVKDCSASLPQLKSAFQFQARLTFPRYLASQLGKGTGGV